MRDVSGWRRLQCALLLLSLGPIRGREEVRVEWTADAVRNNTPESPLQVYPGDILIFQCPNGSFSNVWYQLDVAQYNNCDCTMGPICKKIGECNGLEIRMLMQEISANSVTIGAAAVYEAGRKYFFTSYSFGGFSGALSNNKQGGECRSEGLRMVIEVVGDLPPPEIYISSTGTPTAGEMFALTCSVTVVENVYTPPTVEWQYSNGSLITSGGNIQLEGPLIFGRISNLTLRFNRSRTSHGGQYKCQASNTIPLAAISNLSNDSAVNVTIQVPPPQITITGSPANDSFVAGVLLYLTCSIQLDPAVDTQISVTGMWNRSGSPLRNASRITVFGTTESASTQLLYLTRVQFNPLSGADSGLFACKAVVEPQTPHATFVLGTSAVNMRQISDIGGPSVPTVNITDDGYRVAGNNYVLTCKVTEELTEDAVITWLNSTGDPVKLHGVAVGQVVQRGNTTIQTLTFNPLRTSHGGGYICTAIINFPHLSIPDSSSNNSFALFVLIPQPTVSISLNHTRILYAGTSLTLTCSIQLSVSVNTKVNISRIWSGPRAEEVTNNSYRMVSDLASGTTLMYVTTIEFSPLNTTDSGLYTCQALVSPDPESVFVITSMRERVTQYITVKDLPSPQVKIRTGGTSTAGEMYILTCTTVVEENLVVKPSVEWQYSNGSAIVGGNGISVGNPVTSGKTTTLTLTFDPLRTSHGGQYTCSATVTAKGITLSSNESVADVIVQSPIPDHPGEVNHTTVVRILVSLTSVRLTWDQPEENNAQITSYKIAYCTSATNGLCADQPPTTISVPTLQPTAVLMDLIPMRMYTVYIQAENDVGLGPQPAQPYFFDSADEEDARPVNVRVAFVSDIGVVISWQLPDIAMSESVVFHLSYTRQASRVTTTITITVPQQQGATQGEAVSGLDSGSLYNFSVSAIYQLLTSTAVKVAQQTKRYVPLTNPAVPTVQPDSITVSWPAPDGEEFVDHYLVEYAAVSRVGQINGRKRRQAGTLSRNITVPGTQRSTQVAGADLQPFSEYTFQVFADFRNGLVSQIVAPFTATSRQGAPSVPQDLQVVNVFHISLGLTWLPPASPNGIITNYTVCYSTLCPSSNDLVVLAQDYISGHTYTLDGLSPGTTYNIRVMASTGGGEGTAAFVTSTTTYGVYPPEISGFPTAVQGIYSLSIQFQSTYGPISHYKVVVVSTSNVDIDTRTEVPDSMVLPAGQNQTYFYAAGAIMVGDLQTTFSVGNGQVSILNGMAFENVRLSANQPYIFFTRLYSSEIPTLFNDSLVTPIYMFVTASEGTTPPSESSSVGAIAGALAAVCSVTIISISIVVIVIIVTRSYRARFDLHKEESAALRSGGALKVEFKENIPMAECHAYGKLSAHQTLGRDCSGIQSFHGGVIDGQQKMEGENDACEDGEEIYEPIPN